MNAERFQTLAGAYGGDLARWPADEQAQAHLFLAQDGRAQAWLADAALLDSVLNTVPTGHQNDLLRERIIRSAPKAAPVASKRTAWASWAGLAAACMAGVIAGAHSTANSGVLEDAAIQATVESSTAFADSTFSDTLGEAG